MGFDKMFKCTHARGFFVIEQFAKEWSVISAFQQRQSAETYKVKAVVNNKTQSLQEKTLEKESHKTNLTKQDCIRRTKKMSAEKRHFRQ
jgi:hypothetical protein